MKAVASSVRPVLGVLAVKKCERMAIKKHNTIKSFIQRHFEQFEKLLKKGYMWKQIASTIQARMNIHSKNLPKTLKRTFYLVRVERKKQKESERKNKTKKRFVVKYFVQEHFEQLETLLKKGYTWRQIANTVQANTNIYSRDLSKTMQNTFYKVRIERQNKKESEDDNKKHNTIKSFVQEHFEQLEALRKEGYTWSEIAKKVIVETNIHSKDLTRTLQRTFYKIQIERE